MLWYEQDIIIAGPGQDFCFSSGAEFTQGAHNNPLGVKMDEILPDEGPALDKWMSIHY